LSEVPLENSQLPKASNDRDRQEAPPLIDKANDAEGAVMGALWMLKAYDHCLRSSLTTRQFYGHATIQHG
jgi:hypothetical protein